MDVAHIISLVGGLGLFLFGMKMMGKAWSWSPAPSCEGTAGKADLNPLLLGVLVGVVVTGAINPPPATTVMVVGFPERRPPQAGSGGLRHYGRQYRHHRYQLPYRPEDQLPGPIAIFLGVFMMMVFKKKMVQQTGAVIIGFGLLFTGMDTMSSAMAPLKDVRNLRN